MLQSGQPSHVHADLPSRRQPTKYRVDPVDPTPSPRLPDGRFAAGNPGGPGRPKGQRQTALQKAAQDAVTPEHIQALVRVALKQGLQGNLQAARLVLDRTCGRAPEGRPETDPVDVVLPNLRTATNCTVAIDKIIAAISAGTVDLPTAKVLLDAVQGRMKGIELTEYEARLVELEKSASVVDLSRRS